MHNGEIHGGTVTLANPTTSVEAVVANDGKFSMTVPAGTYDVTVHRTVNGRKKNTTFNGFRAVDGANQLDLYWPSIEDLAERTAYIRDEYAAGKASAAAGQYSQAATHFTNALHQDMSQSAIWAELAAAHVMFSEPAVVEGYYKIARSWGAGASCAGNLGYAYYQKGNYGQSGAMYKEAAELDPSKAGSYLANAGAAYFSGRMLSEAEAAYKMAASMPGAPSSSWYYWGVCAQSNGNRDDALTAYRGYLNADGNGRFAADARQRIASLGG